MKLVVSFSEISKFVQDHYGQAIRISAVSSNEIEATYKKRILLFHMNVKVEITIVEVDKSSVTVSYDGNKAVELVISKLLKYVKSNYPQIGNAMTFNPDDKVSINLLKIKEAKNITDNLDLQDIIVGSDNITLYADLK